MQIPQDAHLYYITDLQLRRLKLVTAIVAREIEAQQYISDADEEKIKQDVANKNPREFSELPFDYVPDENQEKAHDLAMERGDEHA